jgi:hypothetical protein
MQLFQTHNKTHRILYGIFSSVFLFNFHLIHYFLGVAYIFIFLWRDLFQIARFGIQIPAVALWECRRILTTILTMSTSKTILSQIYWG